MLINSHDERVARTSSKHFKILKFLREEAWSDHDTLRVVTELSSSGIYKTINQLQKQKYLAKHFIPELSKNIIGITQLGVLASFDDEAKYIHFNHFEISKFKTLMSFHHLGLQRARIKAVNANWTSWQLAKHLNITWGNKPDALAKNPGGETIAIELERTIKTKKRYEKIFSIYLQAIAKNKLSFVDYVCLDHIFANRLEKLFSSIKHIPVAGRRIPINQKHRDKIRIYCIDNWPD